jgi:hypothetical protein
MPVSAMLPDFLLSNDGSDKPSIFVTLIRITPLQP